MYKNQLQELAQRSCFNLPSYSCIREGPDHAPRFKATVNFNGETFESPTFCSTLRLAEHAAAEVALNTLASRGPSRALIAGVLDETGVYKNLLQETAHRAGLKLPVYTTIRSGPGHVPVFSCTVELAGMSFIGEPARTKKQAQKNAAMTAWSSLKRLVQHSTPSSNSSTSSSPVEAKRSSEEQEQVVIARILASLQPAGMKNSKQSDSQQGQERFIPVCKDLTPPIPTLYPVQCQGWAYPSFTPEMAIYQMWQQEELFQLQNRRLLAFQVPPVSPGPQILPYMQSILQSDSVLFGSLREQEPVPVSPRITIATSRPLYLADHHVSDPIKGESKVTIREIHEEKPEESVQCSTSVIPDPPVGNFNAEPRLKDPVDVDDKHTKVELERKDENVQLGDNQARQFERTSCSNKDSGYRSPDFQAQNMQTFHSSRVNLQHRQRASSLGSFRPASSVAPPVMIRSVRPVPSSTVPPALNSNMGPPPVPKLQDLAAQIPAPPRMRTGGHSYPASPLSRRMNPGVVRPRFMAPAVRIRSVVPVCSAPPARKMPTSSQEGVVPDRESKDTAAPEDMTTASSELSKLRMSGL